MKQTLIKLSDTHYIVVDDSEIKGGHWCIYNTGEIIHYLVKLNTDNLRKITHSTQPLEEIYGYGEKSIDVPLYTIKGFNTIKQLSLSEVDEVINGYCVNRLFLKWESENGNCYNNEDSAFEAGFKAHQELVKDKLFTIEDLRRAFDAGNEGSGGSLRNRVRKYNGFDEYITNELGCVWNEDNGYVNPKENEWKVEFDEQGKLRLL